MGVRNHRHNLCTDGVEGRRVATLRKLYNKPAYSSCIFLLLLFHLEFHASVWSVFIFPNLVCYVKPESLNQKQCPAVLDTADTQRCSGLEKLTAEWISLVFIDGEETQKEALSLLFLMWRPVLEKSYSLGYRTWKRAEPGQLLLSPNVIS